MISVRNATTSDWERIVVLLTEADLPTEDLAASNLGEFLIAERGAGLQVEVVGLVGLQRYTELGLLRSLVVADNCRSQGLGTRLLRELEAAARESGVKELWLLTIDADKFFRRHGYGMSPRLAAPEVIQGTEEFRNLCPGDATLMHKSL